MERERGGSRPGRAGEAGDSEVGWGAGPSAAPPVDRGTCTVCKREFPATQLTRLGGRVVCARCAKKVTLPVLLALLAAFVLVLVVAAVNGR